MTATDEMINAGVAALTFLKPDRDQVAIIYEAMKARDPALCRLVLAAREVAFGGHLDDADAAGLFALKELDGASEAFAACIPWGNDPDAQ